MGAAARHSEAGATVAPDPAGEIETAGPALADITTRPNIDQSVPPGLPLPPAMPEIGRHMRPLLWRLPLVVFLVVGIATLIYVDRIFRRDYRKEAATQAVQTDALVESFLRHRLFVLGTLRELVGSAGESAEQQQRFAIFSREILRGAPDLETIALLDASGLTREVFRRDRRPVGVDAHRNSVRRLTALERARGARQLAVSGTVRLDDGRTGMVAYVPVVRGERVVGFVAGGITYQALFNDALAGQLQGVFAYRIIDESGQPIAVSPDFPRQPAHVLTRTVTVPGGVHWTLQLAIESLQPRVPRVVNLIVGPLLLLLVLFLVFREEARARRFGEHSLDLEIMSSNLLAANMRLEEKAQQIAEANAAKSRFLANVSHELRTPINAIVGYNALALDGMYGPLPQGLHTAHERIQAASDHLLRLVDDVLDLSKIEVGRLALDLEPVGLGSLIEGIIAVMQPLADSKRLELASNIDPALPVVTSDASRIRQIVLNLTSNAIKFTERGSITLTARRDPHDPDNRVLLEVRDTGIGIARRDQTRIFEEFEQVRPTGRGDSMQRGTGIGLAISRKLARLLGGDLRVYSRVRRGSIFTLELPIRGPDLAVSGSGGGTARTSQTPDVERTRFVIDDSTAAAHGGDRDVMDVEAPERLDHPPVRG